MRFANSSAPAQSEIANNSIVKQLTRSAGIISFMPGRANKMLTTAKSFELFYTAYRRDHFLCYLQDFVAIARSIGGMASSILNLRFSTSPFVFICVHPCPSVSIGG